MNGHVWFFCLETSAGSVGWVEAGRGGEREKAVGGKGKREKEHPANGLCLAAPIINTDLYQSRDEYTERLRNTNGATL